MSRAVLLLLGSIALSGLVACQGEPEKLCDGEKVIWEFGDVSITSDQDVSSDPGVQIDVEARTSLSPGTSLRLLVGRPGEDPPMNGPEVVVSADGVVRFNGVTLPLGRVRLTLQGDNGCQLVEFSRNLFVFDESGDATCILSVLEPVQSGSAPGSEGEKFLNAAADANGATPGFVAHFDVDAGRPDVDVELLVLDVDAHTETDAHQMSGADGKAHFETTLSEGKRAVRAICRWSAITVPRSSAVLALTVDTAAPDCAIAAPTAAVTAADDLDGDGGNGVQFEVVAATASADAAGTTPIFTVEGALFPGSSIAAGQSSAQATLPSPPPASQSIAIDLRDRAGNLCQAAVVLN